jgi:ABC-2 type transport system permease protein
VIRLHLLLWGDCFVQAIRRDLQFRTQAFLNVLSSLAELGLGVIPVLILTAEAGAASGWNGPLAVAVVGGYGVCSALIDCFVAPNMRRIDSYVRRGDLDLILIRPVSAPLYSALRWSEPAELGRAVAGAGLLAAGLATAPVDVTPATAIVAAVWSVIGMTGFALLWANLAYLAFWVQSAEPVNDIALQLRDAGKYPMVYFPRPVRLLLHTVVPAGLIAAVPVQVLTGETTAVAAGLAGLSAAAVLTGVHWRLALRRYVSASS